MRIYYRNNSKALSVEGLTDHEGNVVSGATVEAVLLMADGSDVPGVTNPVPLYPDSPGNYLAVVPPIDLPDGTEIELTITAEYSGAQSEVSEWLVLRDRGLSDECGSF